MAKKNGRDDPPKPQVAENEQMREYRRGGIFLFSGVSLFPAHPKYNGRNYVIGYAAGMYFTSASFEMGHSRLGGDASAECSGLVALF